MKEMLKGNVYRLWKAAICLAFLGFLKAQEAQAIGLPPLINVPPVDTTVYTGDTATFTTTIGVSLTPVTVTWYLGKNQITNGSISTVSLPIVGTTVSTLTIPNVTSASAGNYWVKVENGGGEVSSAYARLTVLPRVLNTSTNVSLLPSQCGMSNSGFHLGWLKPKTSNTVVEASSDFVNWQPIYTNTTGVTNVSYVDAAATNFVSRYYRVRLQ